MAPQNPGPYSRSIRERHNHTDLFSLQEACPCGKPPNQGGTAAHPSAGFPHPLPSPVTTELMRSAGKGEGVAPSEPHGGQRERGAVPALFTLALAAPLSHSCDPCRLNQK